MPINFDNVLITGGLLIDTTTIIPPIVPTWSNVSLLLNTTSTNSQTNSTFIDSSTNNYTVVRNGTATQGSFSPFTVAANTAYDPAVNGGSLFLNGNGDYLNLASTTELNLGSGDFTIEAWVYPKSYSLFSVIWAKGPATSGSTTDSFFYLAPTTGNLVFERGFDPDTKITGTNVPLNTWTHVAAVRSSGSIRLYKNGVLNAGPTSITTNFSNSTEVRIGRGRGNSTNYFNGFISSYRMVKGTAVYTGDFTPSTTPLTAIANTQLLLNFTNAGVYDATTKNYLVTVGNTRVSTQQAKFGSASIFFDGNNDYYNVPSNSSLTLGTGDFTIEGWLYRTGNNPVDPIFNQIIIDYRTADPQSNIMIDKQQNTEKLEFYINGATRIESASEISLNQWIHFAIVKSSNQTKMYFNGVQEGNIYTDNNNYTASSPRIGGRFAAASGSDFRSWNGYMQDIRITKGQALYLNNFTPPTQPFPTY